MDSIDVNIIDAIEAVSINIIDQPDVIEILISEGLTFVYTDGVTITGNGTYSNPLVGVSGGSDVNDYDITATGATSYQDNRLIGKTIITIFTDGLRRKSDLYTFNATTGTIDFSYTIEAGSEIGILCK